MVSSRTGLLDRVARQGVRQEGGSFGHGGRRLALGDQLLDRRICEQRFGRVQAAKFVRADGLALVHRNAADDLGAVFAEQDLGEQGLDLAELTFGFEAGGPFGHLAQRLDIGDQPGQAVGEVLVAFERLAVRAAVFADKLAACAGSSSRGICVERAKGVAHRGRQAVHDRRLLFLNHFAGAHILAPFQFFALIGASFGSVSPYLCGATTQGLSRFCGNAFPETVPWPGPMVPAGYGTGSPFPC
jgi:hypothetical protein